MKLVEEESTVRGHGVKGTSTFTIANSRKAFAILSSNMYQDKIKAIIRELSTNAVDAHIDAGTLARQFEVKLPSQFDLNFSIRDYGTGMSQKKIETLYTTYFGSDKNNSNDFVGCLGLGSKSPFSYSNSFSVTSYYQGTKYIYIAMVSEEGIPVINLMHSEPTREHNGLEVGFAVKPEDIREFEAKAKEVYKYFKHRPIIKGLATPLSFNEMKFSLNAKNGTWGIFGGGQSIATMGHIAYPINPRHFTTQQGDVHPNAPTRYKTNYSGHNEYQQLLSTGIQLNFEIGDLEMTPSREDLQYTKHTIAAIKAKLDEVLADISALVSEQLSKSPSLWEARRFFVKMMGNDLKGISDLVQLSGAVYNGVKLSGNVTLKSDRYSTASGNAVDHVPGTSMIQFQKYGYSNRVSRDEHVTDIKVPAAGEELPFVLMENDIARGAYVACRRMLIDNPTQPHLRNVYLITFADDAARATFCSVMGLDESYITKVSSLPKVPRQKGAVNREKVFKLQSPNNYRSSSKDYWVAEDVDMEDGGLYVEISHFEVVNTVCGTLSPRTLCELRTKFKAIGINIDDIVGVKTAAVKKFKDYEDAEWIDATIYMKEMIEDHVKNSKIAQTITDIATINGFSDWELYTDLMKSSKEKLSHPTKPFGAFHSKLTDLLDIQKQSQKKVQDVLDIASTLGYNIPVGKTGDLESEQKEIVKRYKVLSLIDGYDAGRSDKATVCLSLINEVDDRS
jgi:hypothetical protein